jgi:hypothetical protein
LGRCNFDAGPWTQGPIHHDDESCRAKRPKRKLRTQHLRALSWPTRGSGAAAAAGVDGTGGGPTGPPPPPPPAAPRRGAAGSVCRRGGGSNAGPRGYGGPSAPAAAAGAGEGGGGEGRPVPDPATGGETATAGGTVPRKAKGTPRLSRGVTPAKARAPLGLSPEGAPALAATAAATTPASSPIASAISLAIAARWPSGSAPRNEGGELAAPAARPPGGAPEASAPEEPVGGRWAARGVPQLALPAPSSRSSSSLPAAGSDALGLTPQFASSHASRSSFVGSRPDSGSRKSSCAPLLLHDRRKAPAVSCSMTFRSKSSPSMPLCARARGMGRIHRLDRPLYAVELCV